MDTCKITEIFFVFFTLQHSDKSVLDITQMCLLISLRFNSRISSATEYKILKFHYCTVNCFILQLIKSVPESDEHIPCEHYLHSNYDQCVNSWVHQNFIEEKNCSLPFLLEHQESLLSDCVTNLSTINEFSGMKNTLNIVKQSKQIKLKLVFNTFKVNHTSLFLTIE